MSTNSTIAIKHSENDYERIYCHWDGYPSWNGQLLFAFYNTPEKVQQLIDGGDISSLGMNIGNKLSDLKYPSEEYEAERKRNFQTEFYARDRGEKGVNKEHSSCASEEQEYNYIFDEQSKTWYLYKNGKMQLLENVLKEDYQENGSFFEASDKLSESDEFTIGDICTPEQIERLEVLQRTVESGFVRENQKNTIERD